MDHHLGGDASRFRMPRIKGSGGFMDSGVLISEWELGESERVRLGEESTGTESEQGEVSSK